MNKKQGSPPNRWAGLMIKDHLSPLQLKAPPNRLRNHKRVAVRVVVKADRHHSYSLLRRTPRISKGGRG